MIKKIFSYFLIMTLLVMVSPLVSFGQTTPTPGNFLEINITPQNPRPLQSVQVTLDSFYYDLDRSTITWSVDGQIKKTDVGIKTFTVQAGKNGVKTTVRANVDTPADGTKGISISFVPSTVDLIYESLSYTPPFYKGKALNPNQGEVRVAAVSNLLDSNGAKIPTKKIVYTWKKDSSVQGSASGLGKDSFTFTGSVPIRDALVEVEASSLDNSASASDQVNITNVSPKITFYENSPVYGILFNRAITGTVRMLTDEFSVIAVPYSFSGSSTQSGLDYIWSLNGQTVANQSPKNSFTTRLDKVGSGTANISLKINDSANLFQSAVSNYIINFNKK